MNPSPDSPAPVAGGRYIADPTTGAITREATGALPPLAGADTAPAAPPASEAAQDDVAPAPRKKETGK